MQPIFDTPEETSRQDYESSRYEINNGHWHLVLSPSCGGSCYSLTAHHAEQWQPIFRKQGLSNTDVFSSGAFAMLPYVNRLHGGLLFDQDSVHRIPSNRPNVSSPVHGVGWMNAWQTEQTDPHAAKLVLKHRRNADWPYSFEATQTWILTEHGVSWNIKLLNTGSISMPAGIGFHPYFAAPAGSRFIWHPGQWLFPACDQAPICWHSTHPLLSNQPAHQGLIHSIDINHCFSDWNQVCSIDYPAENFSVHISASSNLDFCTLYRPSNAEWLCVEPSTQAPGAFSEHSARIAKLGSKYLKPQDSMSAQMQISIQ
jgi:aldose 1-epimerase